MKIEQLLPSLWRFESDGSGRHRPVSSYIRRVDEGLVLIDPASDLTPELLPIGLPVRHILITHLQEEHAAGALNFPDATVHVPAGDEYLCLGDEYYRSLITDWEEPWDWEGRGEFRGHLGGSPNERPIDLGRTPETLTAGSSVCGAEIVATPGHGKNAVSLVATIDGTKVAFCGDLAYSGGRLWNWYDPDWDYGLQRGRRLLIESNRRLAAHSPRLLCPSHGPADAEALETLRLHETRLSAVLSDVDEGAGERSINFDEVESAPGFRRITPHLHQWREGNCNVLISDSGAALMVDDGLCYWRPHAERKQHHDRVIADMKARLGISRIEMVIPTHYHGDHTENIPDIVETDGAEVVCLDSIADVVQHGERFGLACSLSWYGTAYTTIPIDRRVASGSTLRWREYELEIFHLAGQTYYHLGLSVMVDGLRVLFVGDAAHLQFGPADAVLSYNDAEPYERGWSYGYDRMAKRQPDLLVCGHGSAIRDPAEHIARRRAYWASVKPLFESLSARDNLRAFFDPFHEPGI